MTTPCWTGPSSAFEVKLLTPFSTYALEQLRQRFLFSLTTTRGFTAGARAALQMVFETEIGTALAKLVAIPPDLETSNVCERRRYIDVDNDMRLNRFLLSPALADLATLPDLPVEYVNFLARYLASDYPRYRVSAIAGVLCVAKAVT